jgi:hypothetical protein
MKHYILENLAALSSFLKHYILENLAVSSIFLNTLTGGSRFNSFSARTYYCARVVRKKRYWVYIMIAINTVFFFDPDHCENEYNYETKLVRNSV